MQTRYRFGLAIGIAVVLTCGLLALAQQKADREAQQKPAGEQEKKVTEADVPKAALDALKKLAGDAKITEFAEEVEHGQKFYEGSWTGPGGKVDALVSPAGDVVEIEEQVAPDKVPAAVVAAAEKEAGKDAKVTFEKKTIVMYEAKFKKGDKQHELVLSPTGQRVEQEEGEKGEGDEKDED